MHDAKSIFNVQRFSQLWHWQNWVLVCWCWLSDWWFARLTAPVVPTTSIILSSNKIQNGDILVPANPDPSGKMLLKRTERALTKLHISEWIKSSIHFCQLCLITNSHSLPVKVTIKQPSTWTSSNNLGGTSTCLCSMPCLLQVAQTKQVQHGHFTHHKQRQNTAAITTP